MIQGSTAVYSRKVEYLHSLVIQALELVTDQKKAEKTKSKLASNNPQNQSEERSIEDQLVFSDKLDELILDDVPEGSNIDLEVDYDDIEEARRQSRNRSSLASEKMMSRTSMVLMHSMLSEDHGSNTLKMSMCDMDTNGALMIGGKVSLGNASDLLNTSASMIAPVDDDGMDEDTDIPFDDVDDVVVDEGHMASNDVAPTSPEHDDVYHDQHDGDTQRHAHSVPVFKSKQIDSNALSLLDPHQATKGSKPLKKGKCYKTPIALNNSDEQLKRPSTSSSTKDLDCILQGLHLHTKGLSNPSFNVVFKENRRRRLAERLKIVRENKMNGNNTSALEFMYTAPDEGRDVLGTDLTSDGVIEDDDNDDEIFWGSNDVAYEANAEDDNANGSGDNDNVNGEHFRFDQYETEQEQLARRVAIALEDETNYTQITTYESLCRRHIENFMRGAELYARETGLSTRVSKWTQKLEPILEEEESRPSFDIHSYSNSVLTRIDNEVSTNKRNSDKKQIEFSDIVQGESSSEVCRIFLACLQLSNAGNISVFETKFSDGAEMSGSFYGSFGIQLLNDNRRLDQNIENIQLSAST